MRPEPTDGFAHRFVCPPKTPLFGLPQVFDSMWGEREAFNPPKGIGFDGTFQRKLLATQSSFIIPVLGQVNLEGLWSSS